MKVAVIGLWHLGCVTAACLTKFGHTVIAYDEDSQVIANLNQCSPPIYEPGLTELISIAKQSNTLFFTNDPAYLQNLDVIWITYDTSINDLGQADVNQIKNRLKMLFPYFKNNVLIIISSQIPIGTTQEINNMFLQDNNKKQIDFVYSPENLRLGKSIDLFLQPDRIIMGVRSESHKPIIKDLLQPIADKIIWMSIESAEMTKHALNAFLATSIVFINEVSTLCEYFGADASAVSLGLKADLRIGAKSYLCPGIGFSGGTLARDINYLVKINEACQQSSNFFQSVLLSNQKHNNWLQKKISETIVNLKDKKFAILGLTYKSGTDTLRHSLAINISLWLNSQGAIVNAYDPVLKKLPPKFEKKIYLQQDMKSALFKANAVVIGTEYPEFRNIQIEHLDTELRKPYIFDTNGFLSEQLEDKTAIKYFRVGCSNEITQ
ncbi:nucleotide sugar dehydrogenase [Rickettsiella endosymbiont of Aleochara curtula]|uniref:nucleotide sugar dehydrogenase n=1 Tax=Rickettsiella endosymbiont of Aleochara curtula TaxID=3077936 RepID=UPI00313B98B0